MNMYQYINHCCIIVMNCALRVWLSFAFPSRAQSAIIDMLGCISSHNNCNIRRPELISEYFLGIT